LKENEKDEKFFQKKIKKKSAKFHPFFGIGTISKAKRIKKKTRKLSQKTTQRIAQKIV